MTRSPSFPFPSKVDRSANVKAASYVEVKARPQSSAREQRPKRGGSGSGDRRSKVLRGGGAGGTAGQHVPVMLQAPFTAGAAERFAAALASPHDAVVRRLPYGAGGSDLTHDWVSKSADEGTLLPQDAPPPCDPASLNSEQRWVFEKLMVHRRAQIVSETSGTPPPSPLRLTVYGLGGTGKSHVLNCFKQAIDAEADRANAVAAPGSAEYKSGSEASGGAYPSNTASHF